MNNFGGESWVKSKEEMKRELDRIGCPEPETETSDEEGFGKEGKKEQSKGEEKMKGKEKVKKGKEGKRKKGDLERSVAEMFGTDTSEDDRTLQDRILEWKDQENEKEKEKEKAKEGKEGKKKKGEKLVVKDDDSKNTGTGDEKDVMKDMEEKVGVKGKKRAKVNLMKGGGEAIGKGGKNKVDSVRGKDDVFAIPSCSGSNSKVKSTKIVEDDNMEISSDEEVLQVFVDKNILEDVGKSGKDVKGKKKDMGGKGGKSYAMVVKRDGRGKDGKDKKVQEVEDMEVYEEDRVDGVNSTVDSGGVMEDEEIGDGKRIRNKIRKIKEVLDDLEDDGADRKRVRKIRSDLDGIVEIVGEWLEGRSGKEKKMDLKNVGRQEIRVTKELSRKVEDVEGVFGNENRKEMVNRWVEDKIKEIGIADYIIQVFDCKDTWSSEMVKIGLLVEDLKDMGYDRRDIKEWTVVRRIRERMEGLMTCLVKVPRDVYQVVLGMDDKKIKVEGRWVKVGPYIDLKVCYRCLEYGHIQDACKAQVWCGKCGGRHSMQVCGERRVACAVCIRARMEGQGQGHMANGVGCPLHRALLGRMKIRAVDEAEL